MTLIKVEIEEKHSDLPEVYVRELPMGTIFRYRDHFWMRAVIGGDLSAYCLTAPSVVSFGINAMIDKKDIVESSSMRFKMV